MLIVHFVYAVQDTCQVHVGILGFFVIMSLKTQTSSQLLIANLSLMLSYVMAVGVLSYHYHEDCVSFTIALLFDMFIAGSFLDSTKMSVCD